MVKYYLTGATILLDSDDPARTRSLRQALASGDIDVVLGWGSVADPKGAAVSVISAGPADGRIMVDSSTLSWWIVNQQR